MSPSSDFDPDFKTLRRCRKKPRVDILSDDLLTGLDRNGMSSNGATRVVGATAKACSKVTGVAIDPNCASRTINRRRAKLRKTLHVSDQASFKIDVPLQVCYDGKTVERSMCSKNELLPVLVVGYNINKLITIYIYVFISASRASMKW